MHCSVSFKSEKSDPGKPRDRINPKDDVIKECMQPLDSAPFHHYRPNIILDSSKPSQYSLNELLRESYSSKKVSYWPVQRRGEEFYHDGGVAEIYRPTASLDPMRPVPEWVTNFSILVRGEGRKCKPNCYGLKALLPCFPFHPYFGADSLTVFYFLKIWPSSFQRAPEYRLFLGSDLLRLRPIKKFKDVFDNFDLKNYEQTK